MKLFFYLFLLGCMLCIPTISNSQNLNEGWYMSGSVGSMAKKLNDFYPTVQLSVGKKIGKYNDFEIFNSFIFKKQFETNTVANIKTHLFNDFIILNTGIGLGTLNTEERTDHHYHTYNISFEYCIYRNKNIDLMIDYGWMWKTYAEHIGFNSNRMYRTLNLKLGYKFQLSK